MLTANKIPDNHINFWDEIFKAGDEVLNNLLKALNEHIYNNGIKVKSPVISFFSASNGPLAIFLFHFPDKVLDNLYLLSAVST